VKRKKNRTFKLDMDKPATGAGPEYANQQEKKVVKIKPFKARRDLLNYPVRKGQGVTINGWQFEVKSIRPNGMLYLRPIGQITADLTAPKAALKQEEPGTVLAPKEGSAVKEGPDA
jgi:hypothetical protein